MIYSKLYLNSKNSNWLSLVAIFISFIIVFLFAFFFKYVFFNFPLKSKASKIYLKRLEVVNVSYNKVDIFWETNKKEISWIAYGENKNRLSKVALDLRDTLDKRGKYIYHIATLGDSYDLKPDTTYFFKVLSKKKVYTIGNKDVFSFRTPKFFNLKVGKNFAYGKIFKKNSSPLSGAFVMLNIPSMFPMVVLSKSTGEWFINLSNIVSREERTISNISDNTLVTIEVLYKDEKSFVKAKIADLKPLQPIVLGRNYDFTLQPQVLSASSSVNKNYNYGYKVEIIYPHENAVLSINYPLIKGTGVPGKEVLVTIKSNKIFTSKVRVNEKGIWMLKVPLKLSVGRHKLIIKTVNKDNEGVILKRDFYIAKSGESVLGEATSSAELTPSISVPTFTPTPTVSFTPSPTLSLRPTVITSKTPTTPVTGFNIEIPSVIGLLFLLVGASFLIIV